MIVAEDLEQLRLVVVGSPYSGTRYTAELLTWAGLPCSHEGWCDAGGLREEFRDRLGKPRDVCIADSSGCWANPTSRAAELLPYGLDVLHLVRHPFRAIRSRWEQFRFSPEDLPEDAVRRALDRWIEEQAVAERICRRALVTARVRIEDGAPALLRTIHGIGRRLPGDGLLEPPLPPGARNRHFGPTSNPIPFDLHAAILPGRLLPRSVRAAMVVAESYGYTFPS